MYTQDYRKESHPGERRGDRKRNKRDGTLARFALVSNWGTLKWRGGSIEDKSVTYSSHTRESQLVNVHVVVNYTRTLRRLHQG